MPDYACLLRGGPLGIDIVMVKVVVGEIRVGMCARDGRRRIGAQ